ncbi:unnamed protein product [Rhodiola kirilowii]
MALAGARRLYFLSSKSIWTTRTRSTATLAAPSHSKKVADRIVKLFAIDPEGQKREIVGLAGQTLLKTLANNGLIDPASHRLEDIDACSAECEVNIAQEWLEKLPSASYDEQYVLKRILGLGFSTSTPGWDARSSCLLSFKVWLSQFLRRSPGIFPKRFYFSF